MSTISNVINEEVPFELYDFNQVYALRLAESLDKIEIGIDHKIDSIECPYYTRNPQTTHLLKRLESALIPYSNTAWLKRRGIVCEAFSLDYNILSVQDLLDLYVIPSDHIIKEHGFRPIDGPVFPDWRNGELVGICVRNITCDIGYASSAKFTISNYGWYLYGYDEYTRDDEVYLVEGVFDAIVMRQNGYKAIAGATAYPTAIQLACLQHKYRNLRLCLDNDFWGKVGAYIIGSVTNIPIYMTELKDAGCYVNSKVVLNECTTNKLWRELQHEIPEYNRLLKENKLVRRLPYNTE